jgi:FkbM family methyltransferase
MFQHQGVWLPDGEKHFPEWMTRNGEIVDGRGTYQIKKIRAALSHCRSFRTAVDVGGHVGLWSMRLVKTFQVVHAFEPMAVFRECFERNLAGEVNRVVLYPVALGRERGRVSMAYDPADSGGTHVDAAVAGGDAEMLPLDEYDFSDVDLVKIDCEGFEHHVIAGARETLLRCRPCVIVEQKPHKLGPNFGIKGTPAVDALRQLGWIVQREIGGDYIMTFKEGAR